MNTKLFNVGCDAKNASNRVVSQENVNSSDMSFNMNKPKPISQDDVNNNEWTLLQTASGAIVIIVASLIITISNL